MVGNGGPSTEVLGAIARDFGTPCFVYFMDEVRARVAAVRSAFGNRFRISYAVKSNPNPAVLRRMRGLVDLLDVSSAGEVALAVTAGWSPRDLSFTGPGKTCAELQVAVEAGVGEVILESIDEAEQLNSIAAGLSQRQAVLIRIAPSRLPRGFGVNMSGKPSQFGVDEEVVDAAVKAVVSLPHLELAGFHIYSGTQCLKAEAIVENYENFIGIFRRVCDAHGLRPRTLVFGSGIGIPYYDSDLPVDLPALGAMIAPALDGLKSAPSFAAAELVLETGRYLVGEAGVYVTRVIRTKHSRGTDIAICDGGMHHHLGAAGHLGSVVQRNYRMFKIAPEQHEGTERPYDVVGPLCTTIDTLGRRVKFNGLAAGDLIGIACSGAYGVTASPIHFISHVPPKEIMVETAHGQLTLEDCSQFEGREARAERRRPAAEYV